MSNTGSASADHRSQVHTEVRAPIETVLSRIVLYVFGFIEVLIGIRFVLKLFGANTESAFVQMVYNVSAIFMAPFSKIFATQHVSGSTFEWSALVAIAMYALIGWGIVALIRAISPRSNVQTVARVEKDQDAEAQR